MKKLLLILLLLGSLTACQAAQVVLPTPSFETSNATSEQASNHTPEPTTPMDLLGYKVLVGDEVNDLRPVTVNGEIVYLADQSFIERDQRLEWDSQRALPPGAHGRIC